MTKLDLTKPPVVAYCYYNEHDDDDDEALIVCLECDDKFVFPPKTGKANIRDKDHWGQAVPHVYCDLCDEQVTS